MGHTHDGVECQGHSQQAPPPQHSHSHASHSHDGVECQGHGGHDLSPEEIAEQERREVQGVQYMIALMEAATALGVSGADGLVASGDKYRAAKAKLRDCEDGWDAESTGAPFPFRDGRYSYHLT